MIISTWKTIKISWHCFFHPICLYLIFNHYAPISILTFGNCSFDHKTFHFIFSNLTIHSIRMLACLLFLFMFSELRAHHNLLGSFCHNIVYHLQNWEAIIQKRMVIEVIECCLWAKL
ncbi:hypothetical protein ACJX0J_012942, partial [Zea mays]